MTTSYNTELVIGGDSTGAEAALKRVQLYLDPLARSFKQVQIDGVKSGTDTAAAYDKLRKSIDPLYARSKRYEAAVKQLNAALKSGAITQTQYTADLEKAAVTMGLVEHQTENYNRVVRTSRFHTANLAAQFNDIGVMMASGQSPFILAVQQGTQISQVLGSMGGTAKQTFSALGAGLMQMVSPMSLLTIGIIAGAAALVQWGMAAFSAEEEMTSMEEHLKTLADDSAGFADELLRIKSGFESIAEAKAAEEIGRLTAEIEKLNEQIKEPPIVAGMTQIVIEGMRTAYAAMNAELIEQRDALQAALDLEIARREEIQARKDHEENFLSMLTKTVEKLKEIEQLRIDYIVNLATNALADAKKEADELEKFVNMVKTALWQSEEPARKLKMEIGESAVKALELAGVDIASGVSAAAKEAAILAANLGVSLSTAQSIMNLRGSKVYSGRGGDPRDYMEGGKFADYESEFGYKTPQEIIDEETKKTSGGGRGSKGKDRFESELERLQESLMTQTELELANHLERQEILQQALDQRLITQAEYQAAMEELNKQHNDRLAEMDVYRYGSTLQQAESFFGDMAAAMQGGNEKMQRMARAFGAIEALINAWRAYAQVIADPTLPWWAKLPKAMAVLAAGMGAVNAIKGSGSGGGRSAAAGGANAPAAAARATPLQATLNLQGPFANALSGALGPLLDGLNQEAGDRGYQLLVRA